MLQDVYWIFVAVFASVSVLSLSLDLFVPQTLKYKRYPTTRRELLRIYCRIWPMVLFNLFVTHPVCYYGISRMLVTSCGDFVLVDAVLAVLTTAISYDVLTCGVHRVLHHRFFYEPIHSLHHQMVITVACGGLFMQPMEHILINMFPASTGLLLLNFFGIVHHEYTLLFLSAVGAFGACSSHWGFVSRHHDHHITRGAPFSALGILD